MKKILTTIAILVSLVSVNAQTVITNNYDSTASNTDQDKSESFSSFNLHYLSFDGFDNYGFVDHFINPNAFGGEFGLRAQFKSHGNYNVDLGLNYAFELSNSDSFSAYLVLAAGPTFRLQDEIDGFDKKGNISWKNKFNVDGFINPRISLKFNSLVISGGYYYWAPKFKFSKDDGAVGGFNVALGLSL